MRKSKGVMVEMVKHQEFQQVELSIASDQRREQFGYDGLGNWLTLKSDDGDGTAWDLEQSRTNNAANEISGITETQDDPVWVDPAYDQAGSMISGPKPGAETTEHCYQYDAWNRLRRVFTDADSDDTFDAGETIHQESRYDGLNRRIVRIAGSGSSWLRTDFYYNASWQILEEKVSATQTTFAAAAAASTTAKYQYVWDLRYIDSPVLRDEDLDSDGDCTDDEGTGSERLSYANDANFNVTALVETDGTAAERTIYDAYGQPTLYDATWATTIAESASKANEIRFCGYVYDAIVGLYHVRYRVYHPTLGRWVQRDPLNRDNPKGGYHDGASLVLYVGSSPVDSLDTYGTKTLQLRPADEPHYSVTREYFIALAEEGVISLNLLGKRLGEIERSFGPVYLETTVTKVYDGKLFLAPAQQKGYKGTLNN